MADLTPRENFLRFFRNEPVQWMPSSRDLLRFNPGIYKDNIARGMVNEERQYKIEDFGGKDFFDVPWVYVPAERGSIEPPGYTMMDDINDWKDIVKFPDLSALDWAECAERNKDYLKTDKIIYSTIFTSYFERLIAFLGFEDAAVAMIDEDSEDAIRELFDKLTDFYVELIGYFHKYFNTELLYFHDDWGTQKSTFFSVDTHKEMIVPYLTRIATEAHKMGVYVEMHSCGCIGSLIPNLISTGIDSWRGQPKVNDKLALVNQYGDQFKFGVEIVAPDHAPSDEEALALAKEFADQYKGKNVWVVLTRGFTDDQMDKMFKLIYDEFGQHCPY